MWDWGARNKDYGFLISGNSFTLSNLVPTIAPRVVIPPEEGWHFIWSLWLMTHFRTNKMKWMFLTRWNHLKYDVQKNVTSEGQNNRLKWQIALLTIVYCYNWIDSRPPVNYDKTLLSFPVIFSSNSNLKHIGFI